MADTVHVVSWECDGGGGGFEWYLDSAVADKEYCSVSSTLLNSHVYRFDFQIVDDQDITEQIEQYLMDCDFRPRNCIRRVYTFRFAIKNLAKRKKP